MNESPADPAFWNERYGTGRNRWQQEAAPSRLQRFLATLPAGRRVLIPGSGAGRELEAFVAAGHDALALDFSTAAVELLRARLGPDLHHRVILGDFFAHPLPDESFDLIYERTFLCALPPELRPDYIERVHGLLRPTGRLAGYFYLGSDPDGPPYPLDPSEAESLFSRRFALELDESSPDALPVFAGGERWREYRALSVTE